jgi:hypothetical protein
VFSRNEKKQVQENKTSVDFSTSNGRLRLGSEITLTFQHDCSRRFQGSVFNDNNKMMILITCTQVSLYKE